MSDGIYERRPFARLMHRRSFISGTTLLFAAAASEVRGASTAGNRPLACSAFVDRATISFDEQFALTALIEWIEGDGRIFLPLSWGYRGFQVSTSDAIGTLRSPPINNFHPSPPQAINDPAQFIHMFKGMIIGEKITPMAREFFPGPGRYTVFVNYLSPVPREFTTVAKAVLTEDGLFPSPPISVLVT